MHHIHQKQIEKEEKQGQEVHGSNESCGCCGKTNCTCSCNYDCCCCGQAGYCCAGQCGCCCGFECGPSKPMTKEQAEAQLLQVATDVWMKLFIEACEKEYKKKEGKRIQKLAAEHVKKAIKEWNAKVK